MPDPISTSLRVTICIMGTILFMIMLADLERNHRHHCAMHPDDQQCTSADPVTPTSYE